MDFDNRDPIFLQIARFYERLISLGALKEGDALPSVREVAFNNRVNPNTVERAFRTLVEDGYVVAIPKKGFFVAGGKGEEKRQKVLLTHLAELYQAGYTKEEIKKALEEGEKDD